MTYSDIFRGTIETGSWFTGTIQGTIGSVSDNPAATTYNGRRLTR